MKYIKIFEEFEPSKDRWLIDHLLDIYRSKDENFCEKQIRILYDLKSTPKEIKDLLKKCLDSFDHGYLDKWRMNIKDAIDRLN
jgi:hypothetical protein